MQGSGRLLTVNAGDAYKDFALEEAIFREMKGITVRIWRNSVSVIIGRAQLAALETDLAGCAKRGVPIVRRFTAGGAVYNGPGNFNWSFFVPSGAGENDGGGLEYVGNPRGVFRMASSLLVKALRNAGATTWFEPPNRIVSADGKVGGMAAYISARGLLCHGTLLSSADLSEVARLTTPTSTVAEKRYVRSNSMQVANTGVGYETFVREVKSTLEGAGGRSIEAAMPSGEELDLADALYEDKYGRDEWNLGDPFSEGLPI